MKMTFAFGRFNPSTIGHELLMDKAKSVGGKNYRIYISQSQDRKKNPLGYSDKLKYMKKMFPKHAKNIIKSSARTAIEVAVSLYNEGFTTIIFIAGSDRVKDFQEVLNAYNGVEGKRHGYYKFDSIKVISAGERDPDSEGASGMSASKMRAAASQDDFDSFKQGLPPKFANSSDAMRLFRDIQKAMGVKRMNEWFELDEDEEREYRLGAGATKKKIFQLTWTNPKGKKQKNWVKQLSKNSFQVLKKDGSPKETSTKTTDKYEIIIPDSGFKLKPAKVNKTYAELELEDVEHEGFLGRTLKKKSYDVAVQWYKKFIQRGDNSAVAIHKAASMIKGLNDKDFLVYLQKHKVL